MKAGEEAVDSVRAAISIVLNQMFYSEFLSPSFCLSLKMCPTFDQIHILPLLVVNSIMNHLVTVTGLLLIVSLQISCVIVFIYLFSFYSIRHPSYQMLNAGFS